MQSIFYAREPLLMSGSLVCDILYQYIEQSVKTDYIEDWILKIRSQLEQDTI